MENMKKLPPKSVGKSPSKMHSDEILSSLLRINNFDSISSIKDESLDIDLSACVTISADSTSVNGNSLSSTDFWRMLDDSAQNIAIENILTNSDGGGIIDIARDHLNDCEASCKTNLFNGSNRPVKKDESPGSTNSFSIFLRPDPPAAHLISPLKKSHKSLPAEHQKQRKIKTSTVTNVSESKQVKNSSVYRAGLLEIQKDTLKKNNALAVNIGNHNQIIEPISSSKSKGFLKIVDVVSGRKEVANAELSTTEECIPLYKCLDCSGLVLRGLEEFKTHESAKHHIMYKCSECDRDFDQEGGLKKHLKSHRSMESRKDCWRKCPDCGKCLKLGSMWMHRKIHSDNKKYACDVCGQKFVQKINLTHHSRVHTAEKPYECPECQKRFQERSHLQRHQKYHAQTRSYRCEKCGKMYKTERCLKVHNLVHLEQRPFACNVCDKSFISNSKLKQHSNIHTGERPFKCNYCPRDFTNFPNWLKHTRRRHKVDHKTGEHLENIPSYCSKKSTKTAKSQKNNEEQKTNELKNSNPVLNQNQNVSVPQPVTTTTKIQNKRKKKDTTTIVINSTIVKKELTSEDSQQLNIAIPRSNVVSQTVKPIATVKTPKAKRERKQLAPKQVQQKSEFKGNSVKFEMASNLGVDNLNDIHCLSITSAEELIMEQALEMEESGLFDAPATNVVTDNAISSEAAAALHFKMENEFEADEIKVEEEFISINQRGNRPVLCSSLESSPYSSPVSVDIATAKSQTRDLMIPGTTLFIPSTFSLNSSTFLSKPNLSHQVFDSATLQFLEKGTNHPRAQLVYMPLQIPTPKKALPLPSVDTLLFSTNATTNLFRNKIMTQQNLS